MKTIRITDYFDEDHPHDIARIVRVMAARDLFVSHTDALLLWEKFSERMPDFAASVLKLTNGVRLVPLPERDEDLFASIEPYFEVVDDETSDEDFEHLFQEP